MGWRGYIHPPRKTVFFWSQKAACTSLFNFLAGDIPTARDDKKFFHTHSAPYNACMKALYTQGYRSVILVRHPVTRCISAYFNKFCIYRDQPLRLRTDLEPFAQELHDLHCETTGADPEYNTMSFLQFLDAIEASYAQRELTKHPINGHWDSQVPPFLVPQGLYYDNILRVERLEYDMSAIAAHLEMPYQPRQMNRTPLAKETARQSMVDVPACDVTKQPFGYDNFITDTTLARIQKIYPQDFAALGYPLSPDMDAATLDALPTALTAQGVPVFPEPPKARPAWRTWLSSLRR